MASAGRIAVAPPVVTQTAVVALGQPGVLLRLSSAHANRLNSQTQFPGGGIYCARSARQTRHFIITMHGRNPYQGAKLPSRENLSEQVTELLSIVVRLAATAFVAATSINVEGADAVESLGLGAGALFRRTCAGCHSGGGNIIQPAVTLSKKDLEKNGIVAVDDIYNVTYLGKNRMPGYGEKCSPRGQCTFGPRLSDDDIRALAEFVKLQAEQGWPKVPN